MTMGFIEQTNTKQMAPIVDVTFTNAICYGQTGSGKTTGFILPNLENRIKNGHGILVYDFKGNLHTQVKEIASRHNMLDKVFEVGKPWSYKIDILEGITAKAIQEIFSVDETRIDSYWTNSARDLFENIYKLIDSYHKAEILCYELLGKKIKDESFTPTLRNIYSFIKSSDAIMKFFQTMDDKYEYLENRLRHYLKLNLNGLVDEVKYKANKILNHIEKSKEYKEILAEYHTMKSNGEQSGKNGVLNVLNSMLMSAAQNDSFSCNDIDIATKLNSGHIVIINVQELNDTLLNMLNITLYQKLNTRTIMKDNAPITIFVDEAHRVLSGSYLPDVDICRENRFEYIFSTQDYSLLENKLGAHKTYELLRNTISQYSFKTTDKEEKSDELKFFEYLNLINNKSYTAKPIFIDDTALFDVEHKYQNIINVKKYIPFQNNNDYILVYSPILIQQNKVSLRFKDGCQKVVLLENDKNLVNDVLDSIRLVKAHDDLQKAKALQMQKEIEAEAEIDEENNNNNGDFINAPKSAKLIKPIFKDMDKKIASISQDEFNESQSTLRKYNKAVEIAILNMKKLETDVTKLDSYMKKLEREIDKIKMSEMPIL